MAIAQTTTTAAVGLSDLTIPVTSSTGFVAGNIVRLDSEISYVVSVPSTTSVVVRNRGSEGSTAATHQALTNIITGLPSDFPVFGAVAVSQLPAWDSDILTIGVNTAIIPVPVRDTIYIVTKATALSATTLAAPSTAANGRRITFTSTAAVAHVITTAAIFNNGITGGPWSTATFAAFVGAGFSAVAVNGLWMITALPIAAATAFT
jgi:hypothetical protein